MAGSQDFLEVDAFLLDEAVGDEAHLVFDECRFTLYTHFSQLGGILEADQ